MIDSTRRKPAACLERKTIQSISESTATPRVAVGFHANGSQPTRFAPMSANDSAGIFSTSVSLEALTQNESAHREQLAIRILKRIQARLPGRIRRLTVYVTENAVVLAGQCSTYYTKQLAQHVAMGVLEYERLINNIDVRTLK